MRAKQVMSVGQWQVMSQQREEMAGWLAQMRIELDTKDNARSLRRQFEDLHKEYHEIELLMAN